MPTFPQKLTNPIETMRTTGGDREHKLSSLSDEQIGFPPDIAKPWHLGYVGSPSGFILDDDAELATFIEAQSWEKSSMPSRASRAPNQGATSWDAAPAGVDAPAMPAQIVDWSFRSARPSTIQPRDQEWRTHATTDRDGIDAARRRMSGAPSLERSE